MAALRLMAALGTFLGGPVKPVTDFLGEHHPYPGIRDFEAFIYWCLGTWAIVFVIVLLPVLVLTM